jgi:hypothetical protein
LPLSPRRCPGVRPEATTRRCRHEGLADTAQDGSIDVGQSQRSPVDDQATGQHPVLCDELPQRVGQRRGRPGDPAFGFDEAPLALIGQQRFAIVQLPEELHS